MPDRESAAASRPPRLRLARHPLVWIAVIALAPIVASYSVFYLFPRAASTNYGTLLPIAPIEGVEGTRVDGPPSRLGGSPFRLDDLRGRWVVVTLVDGSGCDRGCERRLYATRQARTMQGKEQERVVRLVLLADGTSPSAELLAQHPGLVVVRVSHGVAARFPSGAKSLYVVDPLGNLVLSWPDNPDIKGIAKDLARLLKASQIG